MHLMLFLFPLCTLMHRFVPSVHSLTLLHSRRRPLSTYSPFIFRKRLLCSSTDESTKQHVMKESVEPTSDPLHRDDENDALKWERMYQSHKKNDDDDDSSIFFRPSDSSTYTKDNTNSCEIRVVTFDLDNTLWKTSSVISAANDALDTYLRIEKKLHIPVRVEVLMGVLFQGNPNKYAPPSSCFLHQNNSTVEMDSSPNPPSTATKSPTSPVYLTLLRKDAIRQILIENQITSQLEEQIHDAFHIWSQARHNAIPQYMAKDVVEYLKKIKMLSTSQGTTLVIGAITDGNANPQKVEELKDLFDFCINAETVGISKPHKNIYLAALQHVIIHFPHCIPIIEDEQKKDKSFNNPDENVLGHWWVHVGDDFFKDVVASKALNMRSVWYCELISTKNHNEDSKTFVDTKLGGFLSTSIQDDFADSVVYSFEALHSLISTWHIEGSSTG